MAQNREDREIHFIFWENATQPRGYQGKQMNLEPDFSFRESLYPTINMPEYWSRLGSSKSRTQAQKDESRSVISEILEACSPDTLIAFTDGSCHPNPGPCGAGECVYLPHETTPIFLKQPVSKHRSILLGEMIAIKMVLDYFGETSPETQI